MRFRGTWVGVPAALSLIAVACGGRTFVTAQPGAEGGSDDGESPDAAPDDSSSGDSAKPDAGGGPDVGAETGPPMCPIPATIADGGRCSTPALDCMSASPVYTCGTGQVTGYATCRCTLGAWSCPAPTCIEAGAPPPSCPAPQVVREGVSCNAPGEECKGNPTMCSGSQTFYDVFQCTKTQLWARIVATVCGDAG